MNRRIGQRVNPSLLHNGAFPERLRRISGASRRPSGRVTLEALDIVTSTMDVARENLLSGRIRYDQLGRTRYQGVIAQQQIAGRGQRARTWYAPYGESLCATFYFRRGLMAPRSAGQIALLAGVAAAETLRRLCVEQDIPQLYSRDSRPVTSPSLMTAPQVGLKWPNDLLLNGKKVGGILIELTHVPSTGWVALIGVGINVQVRAFPPELSTLATSLHLEGAPDVSCMHLGERIAQALDTLADVRRDAGFAAILQRWRAYDQTAGRLYAADYNGSTVSGVADGIDSTGALCLRLENGKTITVTSATSLQEQHRS